MNDLIRVAITQGDYNGVGLEVALKALASEAIPELFTPILFADWRLVEYARKSLAIQLPHLLRISSADEAQDGKINVVDLRLSQTTVDAGNPSAASGAGAVASLDAAMEALLAGDADVLVTAPISKEAAQGDNFHFSGHTEYLAAKAGDDYKARMILFNDIMRVALLSTHLPVSEIAASVSQDNIMEALRSLRSTLRADFAIERPKIAILALNPHAGDGGLLGSEEKEIIVPAIAKCEEEGILAFGPFPADGFFGSGAYAKFDAVLAMYHDQGLAPFKALAQGHGVNFTAGLPFVRTSPDHGTACDIAWQGIADPSSMREAIFKAIDIFRTRSIYEQASASPLKRSVRRAPEKKNPLPPKQDNSSESSQQ